jgi:ferritin-like metal-binding protein YciE
MAKKEKMLEDLFHDTLKDIYYAEKKILTALPKMAKAAQSEDLQAAFEKHEGETTDQVERLEQIFELIEQPAKGKICDAINGMIDESEQVMKEFKGSVALDAGLIASAQAVEHYEISRYGTLKAWAEQLGLQQAVSLLDETLEEEKKTDDALTELANAAVNQEAQQAAE